MPSPRTNSIPKNSKNVTFNVPLAKFEEWKAKALEAGFRDNEFSEWLRECVQDAADYGRIHKKIVHPRADAVEVVGVRLRATPLPRLQTGERSA